MARVIAQQWGRVGATIGLAVATICLAACTVGGSPRPDPVAMKKYAVPADSVAAGKAPGARELMERIRAVDPCTIPDREFPKRFGPIITQPMRQAQSFTSCQVLASSPNPLTPRVRFRVTLGTDLSRDARADLTEITVAGKQAFQSNYRRESNTCDIHLPFGDSGFGVRLEVNRHIDGRGSDQAPWPESCTVAKEYAALIAGRALALAPRTTPLPPRSLEGRDPCSDPVVAVVEQRFAGWHKEATRYMTYGCQITMMQTPTTGTVVELEFDRDAEQVGEPENLRTIRGLRAQYFTLSSCAVSVAYRPETSDKAWDAHNISVGFGVVYGRTEDGRFRSTADVPDPCGIVTQLAEAQLDHLRQ